MAKGRKPKHVLKKDNARKRGKKAYGKGNWGIHRVRGGWNYHKRKK